MNAEELREALAGNNFATLKDERIVRAAARSWLSLLGDEATVEKVAQALYDSQPFKHFDVESFYPAARNVLAAITEGRT